MERMKQIVSRYRKHAFVAAALVAVVKLSLLLMAIHYGKELLK